MPPTTPSPISDQAAGEREYRYFTYTGQCGWLEVGKEEYDDSDYRKKRELVASVLAQGEMTREQLLEALQQYENIIQGYELNTRSTAPTTGSAPEADVREYEEIKYAELNLLGCTLPVGTKLYAAKSSDVPVAWRWRERNTDRWRFTRHNPELLPRVPAMFEALGVIAAPASPAASVLSDEQIIALALMHDFDEPPYSEAKVIAYARALLAASMGGEPK